MYNLDGVYIHLRLKALIMIEKRWYFNGCNAQKRSKRYMILLHVQMILIIINGKYLDIALFKDFDVGNGIAPSLSLGSSNEKIFKYNIPKRHKQIRYAQDVFDVHQCFMYTVYMISPIIIIWILILFKNQNFNLSKMDYKR